MTVRVIDIESTGISPESTAMTPRSKMPLADDVPKVNNGSAVDADGDVDLRVRRMHRRDINRVWEFLKLVFGGVNRETVEFQRPRRESFATPRSHGPLQGLERIGLGADRVKPSLGIDKPRMPYRQPRLPALPSDL